MCLRWIDHANHTMLTISRSGAIVPNRVGVGDVDSETIVHTLKARIEWADGRLAGRV